MDDKPHCIRDELVGRKKSKSIQKAMPQIVSPILCENLKTLVEAKWLLISTEATGADKAYCQRHADVWYIIACWIAYKRYPVIDIARYPYNTAPFQIFKLWAYVLNAELDLAQVTFDAARSHPQIFKKIQQYLTPMSWWLECMKELRSEGSYGEPPPKQIWIRVLKNYALNLSQGKIPKNLNCIHQVKLLENALALRKRDPEVNAKLEDYIRAIEKFIAEGAERLTAMWIEGDQLLTRQGKNPTPCVSLQDLEQIKNDKVRLSIITYVSWEAQLVSVVDSRVFSFGL